MDGEEQCKGDLSLISVCRTRDAVQQWERYIHLSSARLLTDDLTVGPDSELNRFKYEPVKRLRPQSTDARRASNQPHKYHPLKLGKFKCFDTSFFLRFDIEVKRHEALAPNTFMNVRVPSSSTSFFSLSLPLPLPSVPVGCGPLSFIRGHVRAFCVSGVSSLLSSWSHCVSILCLALRGLVACALCCCLPCHARRALRLLRVPLR